jgi:hypothetical protein|tara:strand:- start:419 stop:754 length:336 start_codon:yes stop_codon:yes gene_type:complete
VVAARSSFKIIPMSKEFDKYKSNQDFKKYESLNSYLDDDKKIDTRNDKFDKVVTLKVTKETFEMWEQLCENWGEVLGYENKSKIFEFAIVEALNVPISSLGGFNHEGFDID